MGSIAILVVILLCAVWKETTCQTVIPINDDLVCQPHVLTQCAGLNYNTTFPNLRGQSSPDDIENEFLQFEILFRYNCSNALLVLLCSVYAPACLNGSDGKPVLLKPCRNLCEHVFNGCIPVFQEFQYPWPDHLQCDSFPNKTDLCFGPPDPVTIPYPDFISSSSTIPRMLINIILYVGYK